MAHREQERRSRIGAGHDHGPSAAEVGRPGDYRRKLWIAFGIAATIVVAQTVGSVITDSLALLTDTTHAITDASGLLIAARLTLRPATSTRTWGFPRIEVISALGHATLLLVVGLHTAIEHLRRLFEPPEVLAAELLVFGIVGPSRWSSRSARCSGPSSTANALRTSCSSS